MSKIIKIPNHYGGNDVYTLQPDYFCPNCGHGGIWEDSMDDYYEGPGYWCLRCGAISHLGFRPASCDSERKTLEALKKATE